MTSAEVLKLIVKAAKDGQRCPPRNDTAIRRLIREGWVETRVYARNWRVATIIRGEFAGLETKASPCSGKDPWVVSTASGVTLRRNAQTRMRAPSKPRLLTRTELDGNHL